MAPRRVAAQERANAARARKLLDFVALAHLEDQPAGVLSGGQRKLLELARVLMAEPRVILLDEPAAGVNPALLDLIIDRIAEVNARTWTDRASRS
jgi:branched-chain amino acid transport system ATP-binding protein